MRWQGRTYRPGYERLSRSESIGRQPVSGDYHGRILSADASISKRLIAKTHYPEVRIVNYEHAIDLAAVLRMCYDRAALYPA